MTAGLDVARAQVAAYEPADAQQAELQAWILGFCDSHPDALLRTCGDGHLTGAAVVVAASREHVLLHLHAKFGRWLQLGGHCDGDGDLAAVALREAVEESGIASLVLDRGAGILDLDVHSVDPPGEAAHLHLDVAFLVHAPAGAVASMSAESLDLRWFTWDEAARTADESRLVRLLSRARAAVQP